MLRSAVSVAGGSASVRRAAAAGRLATMRSGGGSNGSSSGLRFVSSAWAVGKGWRTIPRMASLQQAFIVPLPLSIVRTFAASPQASSNKTSSSFLERREVQERVLSVVKNFEKVDKSKVTATASFSKDLGLDSLDQVEVLMSIEDEFKIEIPDTDAEKIATVGDTIDYITRQPTAS